MSRRAGMLIALLLALRFGAAGAQRRELAVLAGGTLSGATGSSLAKSSARAGFMGGLSIRLPRSAHFSFQTDFFVVQHRLAGQRSQTSQPPLFAGPYTDEPRLTYGALSVLLRFQRGYSAVHPIRPYIVVGPYTAVRVSCHRDVTLQNGSAFEAGCNLTQNTDNVPTPDETIPASYQDIDLGLLGGLGVEIHRVGLGLRVMRSIRNLVDPGALPTSPLDGARLWSAHLTLEYMIRVL